MPEIVTLEYFCPHLCTVSGICLKGIDLKTTTDADTFTPRTISECPLNLTPGSSCSWRTTIPECFFVYTNNKQVA